MINMNSPTVQMMMNQMPQGIGNIPIYYGNNPTIVESTTQQSPQQSTTPYPSPKEMILNGVSQPIPFAPRNIVGAYNPGYNAMFNGYSNPYMNYGSYGGYSNLYGYQPLIPMDDDARDRQMRADINGLTYDEQLEEDSNIYKTMSRIVSKNLGRSEEEAKECEDAFNIYNKHQSQEDFRKKKIESLHVQIKVGDDVLADFDPKTTQLKVRNISDYHYNSIAVENMKTREMFDKVNRINKMNYLYNSALERNFDNMDLVDFFNNGAGLLMSDTLIKEMNQKMISGISQMYDRDTFKERLLENNGIRSKKKMKAIERFAGRYGVMPDGRPVSPGTDPAVAESFSYDPKTGQYNITAPNFIQNRIEQARASFFKSLNE